MSLSVWCEFVCATCSEAAPGTHAFHGRVPLKEMKRSAVAEGWHFTRDDAFCSRHCKDHKP